MQKRGWGKMGTQIPLDSLKRLEAYLSAKLQPVKPRQSFISQLQKQFGNAKTIFLEKKSQTVTYFFIIIGVITSAIILLLLGKPKPRKRLNPQ